ncbi:MAG TPA: hypothetical protein VFI59_01215 [Actinomycetota bacterium]|nr:hypothetical protein [Actinomycetota bacterium]
MAEDRDLVAAVTEALMSHANVRAVELVGSRAIGSALPLSDWDFVVSIDAVDAVLAALPSLVAPLHPLAQQWDPLGPTTYRCFMLMLRGPVKVDLIFPGVPHEPAPPWTPAPGTLEAIDRHFWDWILWLTSKEQGGRDDLVREQLAVMSHHLLRPLGVEDVPGTIPRATLEYVTARDRLAERYGMRVPLALEHEVRPALPTG